MRITCCTSAIRFKVTAQMRQLVAVVRSFAHSASFLVLFSFYLLASSVHLGVARRNSISVLPGRAQLWFRCHKALTKGPPSFPQSRDRPAAFRSADLLVKVISYTREGGGGWGRTRADEGLKATHRFNSSMGTSVIEASLPWPRTGRTLLLRDRWEEMEGGGDGGGRKEEKIETRIKVSGQSKVYGSNFIKSFWGISM